MKLDEILTVIGQGGVTLGQGMPGPAGVAVAGVGAAFSLVGALIAAGRDPVEHITRITSELRAEVRETDADVDDSIAGRVGQ